MVRRLLCIGRKSQETLKCFARKMVWLFEVDSEVPRELWEIFEEMPPLFYNKPVPSEAVWQHIKD